MAAAEALAAGQAFLEQALAAAGRAYSSFARAVTVVEPEAYGSTTPDFAAAAGEYILGGAALGGGPVRWKSAKAA